MKSLHELADERVSKELDLINLLRKLMLTDVGQIAMFTKTERFLMRNQAVPFVLSTKKADKSESSDINLDETSLVRQRFAP